MKVQGALFKARERRTDNSPNYTGTIEVDGKKLNLAGWVKRSASGIDYISIAAQEQKPKEDANTFGYDDETIF